MDTKTLLELARNYKPSDEEIIAFYAKIEEQRKVQEEQERRSSSSEFMNRTYNL